MKLTRAQSAELARHTTELSVARTDVQHMATEVATTIAGALARLNAEVLEYNARAAEAAAFVKGIADDLEAEVEEKSDAWKEGARGQAAQAMADAWREADEPDVLGVVVLPDPELDDVDWMETRLAELPEEPE